MMKWGILVVSQFEIFTFEELVGIVDEWEGNQAN